MPTKKTKIHTDRNANRSFDYSDSGRLTTNNDSFNDSLSPDSATNAASGVSKEKEHVAVTASAAATASHAATAFDRVAFARHLTGWFAVAQRDLPWRHAENAHDPYRILVSEVMLQQTTVAAVIPYYHRFLERFPTIDSLAEADIDDVLPLWAGLGYYSRARNLHACARAVMEAHGGEFPRDPVAVLALPGIGRYTAGAVTSIAFEQPSPIVDANVARVLARVLCIEGDVKSSGVQKALWEEAGQLVETGAANDCPPSQFNPAMMELGALICTPREPRCEACPVAHDCCAYATGRQNELPHLAPKRATVELYDACAFIGDGERILLRQLPHEANIWWRGMWELPRVTRRENQQPEEALAAMLSRDLGIETVIGKRLKTLRHGVTHHQITLDCYRVEISGALQNARWFTFADAQKLAMPSTMRKLLRWLQAHPQGEAQLQLAME